MEKIKLQAPEKRGMDFIDVLKKRRTIREYNPEKELKIEEISLLLWSTYGITDETYGLKTAPSAGARYPLEIFVCKEDGVFRYIPGEHSLSKVFSEDIRGKLAEYSYNQDFIKDAPSTFVITAEFERTTSRYGRRGIRYVYIDAGHAAQNLLLAATYLGLGACPVGAFDDEKIKEILKTEFEPIYIIPVGSPV